jgi:hypothetical protein
MSKKHSYEFVKGVFESKGYELLSKEYAGCEINLDYICSKHRNIIQNVRFNNLYNGKGGCRFCGQERTANARRIDYNIVKKAFKNKGLILLSKTYINDRLPLDYRCIKHKDVIQQISYDSIRSKKGGCSICARERTANAKRQSFEDVKSFFDLKGLILLENTFINSSTNMRFICPHHPNLIQDITLSNLKAGKGCVLCGINRVAQINRTDYEKIKLEFKEKNLKLLENIYKNSAQLLKYICLKHPDEIQYVSYNNFSVSTYICKQCRIEAVSGSNNWNWNWDLTNEERIVQRKYTEYNIWRRLIFERDNYKCKSCNKTGGKLNAHHIYSYSIYPSLRLNIDNGITLCKQCHNKFHRKYGYKNASANDLDTFIQNKIRKEVI